MDEGKLYGRGLGFPVRVGPDGRLAWSAGEANVRESLRILLLTGRGERLRRPDYGAGLEQFMFEPNTPATWRAIEKRIRKTVETHEPRLRIESLEVRADPADPEAALATLAFTLVATGAAGRTSLSIPLRGR